jgi:hypothetical protein
MDLVDSGISYYFSAYPLSPPTTSCITHTSIGNLWLRHSNHPWHLAWPPAAAALATIRECLMIGSSHSGSQFNVCTLKFVPAVPPLPLWFSNRFQITGWEIFQKFGYT